LPPIGSCYLARQLPAARLVGYPDTDEPWWLGDSAKVIAEFERFIAAVRGP
jgi:hypothetical protein